MPNVIFEQSLSLICSIVSEATRGGKFISNSARETAGIFSHCFFIILPALLRSKLFEVQRLIEIVHPLYHHLFRAAVIIAELATAVAFICKYKSRRPPDFELRVAAVQAFIVNIVFSFFIKIQLPVIASLNKKHQEIGRILPLSFDRVLNPKRFRDKWRNLSFGIAQGRI
jgi:hypothetical protein